MQHTYTEGIYWVHEKTVKAGRHAPSGLAGVMDIFELIKDPFGVMARGTEALYGWVPERYRRHNFFRVIARQLKTRDIEKVIKGDQVYLRLTSAGREKVARDFPMLQIAKQPWDRRWRVVIFDISEINKNTRESLRNKLRRLGFGMLQESVWVTPHDVSADMREFLESKDLGDGAFVLEVSVILAGDVSALVRKMWNLDGLEKEYQDIIRDALQIQGMYVRHCGRNRQHTGTSGEEVGDIGKGDIGKKVREIRERYVQAFLSDPCLPKELLPNDWPARRAREAV